MGGGVAGDGRGGRGGKWGVGRIGKIIHRMKNGGCEGGREKTTNINQIKG